MFLEPKEKREMFMYLWILYRLLKDVLLYEYVKTSAYCNAVVAIALAGMG